MAAAEAALAANRIVTAIDVLSGLGWLPGARLEDWRRGRLPYMEAGVTANLHKLSAAMKIFRAWARSRGLQPSESAYVAWTRDRHPLRFSKSGEPAIERAYSTHWVAPELSEKRRERLQEREGRAPDLVVVSPLKEWSCGECGGTGALLIMEADRPMCLACADMDHLVFLTSGDATLTRRARNASGLSAVVVRFSRSRKRWERQGILVEEGALERAEAECLADEDVRARRRLREEEWRKGEDIQLQDRMAHEIVRLFPGCPRERARAIARHTGTRGSGRVGRTAAGRSLEERAVVAAVVASVRHLDTPYDELLMAGVPRAEARERVWTKVQQRLEVWRPASTGSEVIAVDRIW